MNKKTILGLSLGVVFAVAMMGSPAIADHLDGHITEATLKDHASGKKPANNPAHYELIANATGNYTQFAIDATTIGGVNATGFGIVNQTGYVWAFASHEFDDCTEEPCGEYNPHGHEGQLIASADCTDPMTFELVDVSDLGEAKVEVAEDQSYSIISLDDIPADAKLNLQDEICDVNEVDDVADIVAFNATFNKTGGDALCVTVDLGRSLEIVAGLDGPDMPKNKNKNGGFNSTGTGPKDLGEADFCPAKYEEPIIVVGQ